MHPNPLSSQLKLKTEINGKDGSKKLLYAISQDVRNEQALKLIQSNEVKAK